MTENYPPGSAPQYLGDPLTPLTPLPPAEDEQQGTVDVAKDQAADLGQSGVQAGKRAVGVAQQQASQVATEASRQGQDLLRQAQAQLGQQAAEGQQRLATQLLSLSDELSSMAAGSDQNGVAADMTRQAASRARDLGQWLGHRGPGQVIDDVQAFARRRPGVFVTLAVGAGLVAGRLTRGLAAVSSEDRAADPAAAAVDPQQSARPPAEPATGPGYQPEAPGDVSYQPGTDAAAGHDGPVVPVTGEPPASGGGSLWDTAPASGERGPLDSDQAGTGGAL